MPTNSNTSAESSHSRKNFFRRVLDVLLLAAVLWFIFALAGSVLRKIAVAQLAELTNTKVVAESVKFRLNGSVLIEKLVIAPHRQTEYDNAILRADLVYVRFGIVSLLSLRPKLEKISIKDFVFTAQEDLDSGRWNIEELKIPAYRDGSGKIPFIRLKRGNLQYVRVSKGQSEIVAAAPVDMRLEPAENLQDGCCFNITAQRDVSGRSSLEGYYKPGKVTIAGGLSSADITAFGQNWKIDALAADLDYSSDNNYLLKIRIKDFSRQMDSAGSTLSTTLKTGTLSTGVAHYLPRFLEKFALFSVLQDFFNWYRPGGRIAFELEASGNLERISESKLTGRVYCKDVSICYEDFPYAVTNLTGQVGFTENSVALNHLAGKHGGVDMAFNGWVKDFGLNWRCQVDITSNNMALDNDLYEALNPQEKLFWSAFSPKGLSAINYRIIRNSPMDKQYFLSVELHGIDCTYRDFPYPLKNLAGTLFFDRQGITFSDLVSQTDGKKITLNGKTSSLDVNQPVYDISIDAQNIPLDSTLVAAMPAGPEPHVYDRFDTAGLIRIENFTGQVWSEGKNKQTCYRLSMQTGQVVLDGVLFGLLPEPLQKFVSDLQPEGKINCCVDLDGTVGNLYPDYRITVDCLGNSADLALFPYPLKNMTGTLTVTKDNIRINDITANAAHNIQITSDLPTLKINGSVTLSGNAFSRGRFTISADNIFFDEQLGVALPESIQPFYFGLSPTGRFDLDLEDINFFIDANGEKYIDFDCIVNFKTCDFKTSAIITGLDAVLKAKCSYKIGDWFRSGRAELVAENIDVKGKSLKNLTADFHYDPNLRTWLTSNLVADCYGGRLEGGGELKKPAGKTPEYLLYAGFDNIDLKRFLSDVEHKESRQGDHTSGKMAGSLSLGGRVDDDSSRIGRCRLKITDMQVGKPSPMAKLLYVLKLTEPKDFVFEQMLVDSYIKRNKLSFRQFDLSGEAVAFSGTGWMDLQTRNVNLVLAAHGRRLAAAPPSVWQSLTDDISNAVVQMDVAGDLYDPQITTRTLPVIKKTMGILGTKPSSRR